MSSPLAAPGPWDLVASAYTEELVPQFERFAGEALRLASVPPSSKIVDVAAGPGTLTRLAARAGHGVAAVDFSPNMIARLKERIESEALSNVEAQVGDGMALPFEDASFDAGFSMFGLMFFPDRNKGFRELLRVVRPGAPVVVSSWHPFENFALMAAAFAAMAELSPPPPGSPPFKPPLASESVCVAEMSDAGFRDVAVHTVTFEEIAPSVTEFWDMMVRTSAPFALRKKMMGSAWDDFSKGVLERLHAKLGNGPQKIAMPAFLTVGRK